jgi:hypothetical protein
LPPPTSASPPQVGFVDSIGAYYDVRLLLKDVTTGPAVGFEPSDISATVLRKQVIDATTSGADRSLLLGIFYDQRPEDRDLVHRLSDEGRAVFDLLDNTDPARFDALLGAVLAFEKDLEDLLELSPSQVASELRAPLRILHARRDRHVPYAHAALLREGASQVRPSLQSFDAFDHVDPRLSAIRPALTGDALKMYWYLYGLIRRLE